MTNDELDQAVATEVLGWTFCRREPFARRVGPDGWYDAQGKLVFLYALGSVFNPERDAFRPSRRIEHAWMVLDALREREYGVQIEVSKPPSLRYCTVSVIMPGGRIEVQDGDEAARALCLAALRAVRPPVPA